MASTFSKFPTVGGDNNTWGTYVLALERAAIGEYTSYLFDDSGTLKVSAGRIGINDGTNSGVSEVEETAIALSGTAGIWQKIEMGVSGSSVTFYCTDLAGETDPTVLPAAFTGGHNATKQGYYIISTRRTIGVVWVDSGGNLAGIINTKDRVFGYYGDAWLDAAQSTKMEWDKSYKSFKRTEIIDKTWNMDVLGNFSPAHYLSDFTKIKTCQVWVIDNAGANKYKIEHMSATGGASQGRFWLDATQVFCARLGLGFFDAAGFNAAAFRAVLEIEEE